MAAALLELIENSERRLDDGGRGEGVCPEPELGRHHGRAFEADTRS